MFTKTLIGCIFAVVASFYMIGKDEKNIMDICQSNNNNLSFDSCHAMVNP